MIEEVMLIRGGEVNEVENNEAVGVNIYSKVSVSLV